MNLITFKTVNFLTRSDACNESLMLSNMDRTSNFQDGAFRFQMMPVSKVGKLKLDLVENSVAQCSSDWWPHQQYALECYPEKTQSCTLLS